MKDAESNSEEPLAVDHEYENDSDYGSSVSSDTTSLSSSIMEHVYENGRRYHRYKEGAYPLPNDETEQDRLDMHHHIFRLLLKDKIHLAPIGENPQRILDVGTGTGIWAIEMADLYPSAEVIGIDLSPIQPQWVPPNCRFEVDDAELDWTFPESHFDLIHSRNLMQSIKDWPRYLKQMYKHLQPGAYIDIAELEGVLRSDDNTIPPGCPLEVITGFYSEGLKKAGLPQKSGLEMKAMIEVAGFEDVELYRFKQPLGSWPKNPVFKTVGQYLQMSTESGFEAYALALMTRVLGKTTEEAMEIIQGAIKDVHNRRIHSYNYFFHVVARKPMNS